MEDQLNQILPLCGFATLFSVKVSCLLNSKKKLSQMNSGLTMEGCYWYTTRKTNKLLRNITVTDGCPSQCSGLISTILFSVGDRTEIEIWTLFTQISSGKKKVLYVGITCGFSAAYVAGQLEYCMDNLDRFIPVVLGFNPVSCARLYFFVFV